MQFLHILLAGAVAISAAPQIPGRVGAHDLVLVQSVVDGGTIVVSNAGRVRLLGIVAPPVARRLDAGAPFGREARDRLTTLVLHRWVRLEQDAAPGDGVSRHAAYVITGDGTFINATMVREGLARVSARSPLARLDELRRAESEAQAFRRGMWGGAPQIPSAGYTRRSKVSRPPPSRAQAPPNQRRSTRKKKP